MSRLFVDFSTGLIERQYRGARTVRFVAHMRPESIERLQAEIVELLNAGYAPTKYGTGWLYEKGGAGGMSNFHENQHVKLKDDSLPIIADQMAEDLTHLVGVVGILHKAIESQWDWYFDTATYGSIPVLNHEIEAVQP